MKSKGKLWGVAGALFLWGGVAAAGPAVGSQGQASQKQSSAIPGVIQRVDKANHSLTLILPAGQSVTYERIGNLAEVSREQDMVGLNVPVSKQATIEREGKQASFDQLKMGDSVRVSFDAKGKALTCINAKPLDQGSPGASGAQGSGQ